MQTKGAQAMIPTARLMVILNRSWFFILIWAQVSPGDIFPVVSTRGRWATCFMFREITPLVLIWQVVFVRTSHGESMGVRAFGCVVFTRCDGGGLVGVVCAFWGQSTEMASCVVDVVY